MADQKPKTAPTPRSVPKPTAAKKPAAAARKTVSSSSSIEKSLNELVNVASGMLALRGDMYPSLVVAQEGPGWSTAMVALAEESPAVKQALTKLTQGGVVGAAVISSLAMVAPVLAYYGVIPGMAAGIAANMPFNRMDDPAGKQALQEAWAMKYGTPEGGAEEQ